MAPKDSSKKRKAAPSSSTKHSKKPRKDADIESNINSASNTLSSEENVDDNANPSPPLSRDVHTSADDVSLGEEDDQTAALLRGFESSDEEEQGNAPNEEETTITTIPSIPISDVLQRSLDSAKAKPSEQTGVIYIGRVPHGFYEHQMRAYLAQFGAISRLRLSRNRRTGASKHYAFVEFKSDEVARIVAETMNNYLMFGHILKVKFIPAEQIHSNLFKGADKRFKKVPWNKIERFRLQATDRQGWENRVGVETRRRQEKAGKLKELGYEYTAPDLRQVENVPVKALEHQESDGNIAQQVEDAEVKAIEAGDAGAEGQSAGQNPVSAEPMAIATAPGGEELSTAQEGVLDPGTHTTAEKVGKKATHARLAKGAGASPKQQQQRRAKSLTQGK